MAMLREPPVCCAEPPVYRFFLFWADTCRTSSDAQCSQSICHHFGCIHSGGKGFHCNGSSSSLPTAAGSLCSCFNSAPASSSSEFVCLDLAASDTSLAFLDAANSTLALRFSSHRSEANCLIILRSNSFRHADSCLGAHL